MVSPIDVCRFCRRIAGDHNASCPNHPDNLEKMRSAMARAVHVNGSPKPAEAKRQTTGVDVARTALHILEVQGLNAVKDFLIRTVEAEETRKNMQGST